MTFRNFWQLFQNYLLLCSFVLAVVATSGDSGHAADLPPISRRHQYPYSTDELLKSVPYFQASLPMRVYECLRDFSILRCTKLFVLQQMEQRQQRPPTANLTRDFLEQFASAGDAPIGSLVHNKYSNMSDDKLTQSLVTQFQRFFKHRDIKLHFLPGVMVKIVPSRDNKLSFTLKKSKKTKMREMRAATLGSGHDTKLSEELEDNQSAADSDEVALTKQGEPRPASGGAGAGAGGTGKRKNKKGSSFSSYKSTILQLAVPVMVMPVILMGTVLPFLLPVLKVATIMTMLMNNSAFIAALIYAARTHVNGQEEQHISYGHQGYY